MGKGEGIRIYLRLRPPASVQHSSLLGNASSSSAACDYNVESNFESSTLRFHADRRGEDDYVNNSSQDYTYSFRRVFDPSSSQEDVFNLVAKDCVRSALSGYNSTIFAYGQTGSGKTYSITGGTESYTERGIIPRALAMVYDEVAKHHESNWTVSISYLQIYNDKGQDLLNHGKDAKTLEDLPFVTVHENEEDILLKGLEQHAAPSLADSLNLLFLGDTNRLYCETPMNRTSSRSHCVFTIHLEARTVGSSVVRRSKLNLVDLAGSERVSKTGVGGTILTEAKYINLSLHYLEQVIVALSEQAKGRREHIPYRNSFLTMVLRDSLGGNCRTSMLATAHLSRSLLPETLSTCGFAQRVALIKQDARVNEETDPVLLVRKLKAEVTQLKDQLAFYEKGAGGSADRELSEEEMLTCRGMVDTYLYQTDPPLVRMEGFEGDLARIYYCFDLMKQIITTGKLGSAAGLASLSKTGGTSTSEGMSDADKKQYEDKLQSLQISLQQKENELNMMLDLLQKTQGARYNASTQTSAGDTNGAVGFSPYSNQPPQPPTQTQPLQPTPQTEASVARVNQLTQSGKLSSAQATVAEEYLKRKDTIQRQYDLPALSDAELVEDRTVAFESFKRSYQNYSKVEATKGELKGKYESCKETARRLNAKVDEIKELKLQIQRLRAERAVDGVEEVDEGEKALLEHLSATREQYNSLATSLRQQKDEIDGVHAFMKRSQDQLTRDFEQWFASRKKQVALAAGQTRTSVNADTSSSNTNSAPHVSINGGAGGGVSGGGVHLQESIPSLHGPLPLNSTLPPTHGSPTLVRKSVSSSPVNASKMASTAPEALEKHPFSAPSSMLLASNNSKSSPHEQPSLASSSGGTRLHNNQGWMTSPVTPPTTTAVTDYSPTAPQPGGYHTMGSGGGVDLTASFSGGAGLGSSRKYHLEPLQESNSGSSGSPLTSRNPYAPQHRSTGNKAADEQLAELYKLREAMRLQMQ